jgi:UDP-N-acetylglucosamine transferase subunit ALG13
MIFLTVGSSLPFDRLVEMVDRAVGDGLVGEQIFAQIGSGRYRPQHLEFVDFLTRKDYEARFREASAVVSHAGIGTIAAALKERKPIIVMPRRKEHGELVDDHQTLTAKKFADLNHVLAFSSREELEAGLRRLPHFIPATRTPNAIGIAEKITSFLTDLRSQRI